MTKENKRPHSFRLSPEALRLIKELSERLGISQASVVEQAVRRLAREEGVT
ncbi:MAG: hypothetical protein CYG60_18970 [Actinobacteria bacterium]|nr:MAG: hypothetical protein CYG60_18970 [Actinomycetota bacterium]